MTKEELNRLNAFEMWVWRRMGKVSWMDKRTNEQVLSSMNKKRSLIKRIWDRKKNWIGHIVRGDGLMKLMLEGRMEGKRRRGRLKTERIGEFGSQGLALGQRINDDDAYSPALCTRTFVC